MKPQMLLRPLLIALVAGGLLVFPMPRHASAQSFDDHMARIQQLMEELDRQLHGEVTPLVSAPVPTPGMTFEEHMTRISQVMGELDRFPVATNPGE